MVNGSRQSSMGAGGGISVQALEILLTVLVWVTCSVYEVVMGFECALSIKRLIT